MPDFSFIILTYNEEKHLPRLLESIKELNAETFILDSGSSDITLDIAEKYITMLIERKYQEDGSENINGTIA